MLICPLHILTPEAGGCGYFIKWTVIRKHFNLKRRQRLECSSDVGKPCIWAWSPAGMTFGLLGGGSHVGMKFGVGRGVWRNTIKCEAEISDRACTTRVWGLAKVRFYISKQIAVCSVLMCS